MKTGWAKNFCLAMIMQHIMLRAMYIIFLRKNAEIVRNVVNIATLILKGRSQKRAGNSGPII